MRSDECVCEGEMLSGWKASDQGVRCFSSDSSVQEEDELVTVIDELCELRSRLIEAEDGRMRAEVELEDLKSRKSAVNQAMVRVDYVHFINSFFIFCAMTSLHSFYQ